MTAEVTAEEFVPEIVEEYEMEEIDDVEDEEAFEEDIEIEE